MVLCGESGVSKSSLINLTMPDRDVVKTSPDALASHAPYDVTIGRLLQAVGYSRYAFFHAQGNKVLVQSSLMIMLSGLNEGSECTVPTVLAERNLISRQLSTIAKYPL